MVLGLDCMPPELAFDAFRDDMPVLAGLMSRGSFGRLRSIVPPITVPAWSCMVTSKDPGQLGVYGFRNRKDYSYDALSIATSSFVREKTVWDLLGERGLQSIVLGVPQTYPPKPVRGCLVAGFLTPSTQAEYTFPSSLKHQINDAVGDYVIDVDQFRTEDKAALLGRIRAMTDNRFRVAEFLLRSKPWDFFMMVEMGLDRLHHAMWRYGSRTHHAYVPGNPYENAMREYYRYLDAKVGGLLEAFGRDAAVMVVSDHGIQDMSGGLRLNQWLIEEGYLALKETPAEPRPFSVKMVDWPRTRAWAEGGYYARVFVNVEGREPQGAVRPGDYEAFRDELIRRIEAIPGPDGRPMGTRVLRPESLYRQVRNIPPDLVALLGDLRWRSIGSVGGEGIHTTENDTGPDDANHSMYGVFIAAGPGFEAAGPAGDRQIYDVAPTVLDLFGIEAPSDMIGASIRRG